MVKNVQCGMIPLAVLDVLQNHQDIFRFVKDEKNDNIKFVTLNGKLKTADQRTNAVNTLVREFREKNIFTTLTGWRDEVFSFLISTVFLDQIKAAFLIAEEIQLYFVHHLTSDRLINWTWSTVRNMELNLDQFALKLGWFLSPAFNKVEIVSYFLCASMYPGNRGMF